MTETGTPSSHSTMRFITAPGTRRCVLPTCVVPARLPLSRPVAPKPLHECVSPAPRLTDPPEPGQPAVQEGQGVVVLVSVVMQPEQQGGCRRRPVRMARLVYQLKSALRVAGSVPDRCPPCARCRRPNARPALPGSARMDERRGAMAALCGAVLPRSGCAITACTRDLADASLPGRAPPRPRPCGRSARSLRRPRPCPATPPGNSRSASGPAAAAQGRHWSSPRSGTFGEQRLSDGGIALRRCVRGGRTWRSCLKGSEPPCGPVPR